MSCNHPNPQFARSDCVVLNGKWSCRFDPGKSGAERQFEKSQGFEIPINVTRIANVHYFEFVNQYHTEYDSHNFFELVYVDNGSINVYADNYTGELSNGQMIVHCPLERHALKCENGASPNVIIIGFECDSNHLEQLSHSPINLNSNQKRMLAETVNEGMNVYAPPYDIPNMLDMKKREEYPFGAAFSRREWFEQSSDRRI